MLGKLDIPRQWHPTPVFLPGKPHGRRSLVGCSPWGHWGLDTTEWLHFHFSLSCIGEGNSNPLQCSCLENPRDGGAWWAAVCRVTQSWTRLKWLSSMQKNEVVSLQLVSTYTKMNSKWIKNLNIRPKTIKSLEKTREGFLTLDLQWFLGYNTKSRGNRSNGTQMGWHQT